MNTSPSLTPRVKRDWRRPSSPGLPKVCPETGERLLTSGEVRRMLGITLAGLHHRMKVGSFPRGTVPAGCRRKMVWRENAVLQHVVADTRRGAGQAPVAEPR